MIVDEVCVPKFDMKDFLSEYHKAMSDLTLQCWNYCTMFDMDTRKLQLAIFAGHPNCREEIRYDDDIVIGWIEIKDCKITYSYPKFQFLFSN